MGLSGFSLMGANISDTSGRMSGLEAMPENCVALVLMHMDPTEICKLAGVNRLFRDAASADFIWESKLPCNYQFLMDKVFEFDEKKRAMVNLRKKDVYARLCRRNPLNGISKVSLCSLLFFSSSLKCNLDFRYELIYGFPELGFSFLNW